MKIAFITLFPEMFEAVTAYGISGRAVKNGLVEVASLFTSDAADDLICVDTCRRRTLKNNKLL